jgi:hypothetical protein
MLTYSETVVAKYRLLAITDASKFEAGKTYWSNSDGEFILNRLITFKESYARFGNGLEYDGEDGNSIGAILTKDGYSLYLSDRNVGASYNPWLIFADKKTLEAYEAELNPTMGDDGSDIDYFDYDDRVYDEAD